MAISQLAGVLTTPLRAATSVDEGETNNATSLVPETQCGRCLVTDGQRDNKKCKKTKTEQHNKLLHQHHMKRAKNPVRRAQQLLRALNQADIRHQLSTAVHYLWLVAPHILSFCQEYHYHRKTLKYPLCVFINLSLCFLTICLLIGE